MLRLKMDSFEFDKKDLELLLSIKAHGVAEDINVNQGVSFVKSIFVDDDYISQKNESIRQIKTKWLNKWKNDTSKLLNINPLNNSVNTRNNARDMVKSWSYEKKNSFFVELISFSPYFKMKDFSDDLSELKFDHQKYLSFCASCFAENNTEAENLTEKFLKARNYYNDSLKSISKNASGSGNKNTLMWIGLIATAALIVAPYLAGVIGGVMGLSGAAATSAGLALLGGGSLAAGGFGMAGGYITVLAGGAILGYKKGNSDFNRKLESYSANEILLMCAKLDANMYLAFDNNQSSERKEAIKDICESVRQIQLVFEAKADEDFIDLDVENAKEYAKKSVILVAFRRRLRAL